jgi:hypothetical protein
VAGTGAVTPEGTDRAGRVFAPADQLPVAAQQLAGALAGRHRRRQALAGLGLGPPVAGRVGACRVGESQPGQHPQAVSIRGKYGPGPGEQVNAIRARRADARVSAMAPRRWQAPRIGAAAGPVPLAGRRPRYRPASLPGQPGSAQAPAPPRPAASPAPASAADHRPGRRRSRRGQAPSHRPTGPDRLDHPPAPAGPAVPASPSSRPAYRPGGYPRAAGGPGPICPHRRSRRRTRGRWPGVSTGLWPWRGPARRTRGGAAVR